MSNLAFLPCCRHMLLIRSHSGRRAPLDPTDHRLRRPFWRLASQQPPVHTPTTSTTPTPCCSVCPPTHGDNPPPATVIPSSGACQAIVASLSVPPRQGHGVSAHATTSSCGASVLPPAHRHRDRTCLRLRSSRLPATFHPFHLVPAPVASPRQTRASRVLPHCSHGRLT
jgi:hypothetical protein